MMRKFAVAPFLALATPVFNRRHFSEKSETPKPDTEAEEPAMIDSSLHDKIKADLKEAQEKIAELKKDYVYALAEAENARRIGRDDVEKARNFGISSFGRDMLDVSDTLERAIESFAKLPSEITENKQVSAISTGVKMSQSVLNKHLSKHGIEKIDVKVGDVFNPNFHEALFKAPISEKAAADHVAAVVKPGYMLKERVLRAAQVGVAESE